VRLERRAVEKAELQRMCAELRIPRDFDIAEINWRPDYDPFFYGSRIAPGASTCFAVNTSSTWFSHLLLDLAGRPRL
jgi:hypothetical protein